MPSEHDEFRATVRQKIAEQAAFNMPYITMNALATVVASYGLFSDSTAVVIGAMVIAMLLGPISGIALALVDGDYSLLRQAAVAELGGVAIVLSISFLLGKIHSDIPLTKEIISRSSPNILDLMIALAGGAAGAYATVSSRLSGSIVGVAIATALVPPLAVCGICLARGDNHLALGSFLLFFANFVAIQLTSSVVMWLYGFHKLSTKFQKSKDVLTRNSISLVLLVALAALFSYSFSQSLEKQGYEAKLRIQLKLSLKKYPGTELGDLQIREEPKKIIVIAVVFTPYSLVPTRVAAIERQLPTPARHKMELHIRSVIQKESTRNGYLFQSPPSSKTSGEQDIRTVTD